MRDRLGRSTLHNPFTDALILFKAVPQIGEAFSNAPIVPDTHLAAGIVLCVCGATTRLQEASIVECDGYCGRHFLSYGTTVRAARIGSTQDVDLDAERWAA